jgi:hypothetical protein
MKHFIFLAAVLLSVTGFAKQSDNKVSEIMSAQENCINSDEGQSTVGLEECSVVAKEQLSALEKVVYTQESARFKADIGGTSFEYLYKQLQEERQARVQRAEVMFEGGTGQGYQMNKAYIESTIFIIDQIQGLRLEKK